MFPVFTLHGLNIEPESISYIEWSETSNQPSWHRGSEVRWGTAGGATPASLSDIGSAIFFWLSPNCLKEPV